MATQKLLLARWVVIALSTPPVSKNSLRKKAEEMGPVRHCRKSETLLACARHNTRDKKYIK